MLAAFLGGSFGPLVDFRFATVSGKFPTYHPRRLSCVLTVCCAADAGSYDVEAHTPSEGRHGRARLKSLPA